MSIRRWRAAPKDLARVQLERSVDDARRGWIVRAATVTVALLAGVGAGYQVASQRLDLSGQRAAALTQLQQAEQLLEQTRLLLRMSDARSEELERQIDALNPQLRECQVELTFFREASNSRR